MSINFSRGLSSSAQLVIGNPSCSRKEPFEPSKIIFSKIKSNNVDL
ncbi:hypothetical protein FEM08_18880 [Flavobacterium gilvum]|nr:hypothetical protein FEM08_18880 [Flavobacterium gilvum]